MSHKFIIDNGAYLAKSGFSDDAEPRLSPNYISKSKNGRDTYVGAELYNCKDFSCLFYNLAFHKGILLNWDIQRQVWNQLFKKHNVEFASSHMIITEPMFNFTFVQECLEEIFFEEFAFEGMIRINPTALAAYKYLKDASRDFCLVVDSGYSFTHIAPYYRGRVILDGVRRLDVGGKHLTNLLKEIVSYRQLMVMDETFVMNQVKEELCYVATDLKEDMAVAKLKGTSNTIVRDYVLPDYSNIRKGYAKSQQESTGRPAGSEQIISLNNERFTIPELLFNPSDIGMKEMGVSEAIVDSVQACHADIQPHLYNNIVLIGGNSLMTGFRDRIYKDVRSMISDEYELNVKQVENPQAYAWAGGKELASSKDFNELFVSKKMYEEHGHNICKQKFNICHD